MLPSFVVIGAEKAGSTFLLQCIREHPQIFMPRDEVPFFEDHFFEEVGQQKFAQLFDGAKSEQVVGMKRPTLLGHPESAGRIQSTCPDAKLIAVLRHPVERFLSAYYHFASFAFIPTVHIEVGARKLLDGKWDNLPRAHELLEFGMYGKHISHYSNFFPRDRFLIHLFDEIKSSPMETLKSCYRFLGVEEDFVPTAIDSRPMGAIYSGTRLKLRNALTPFYRDWSDDNKYISHRKNAIYYFNMLVDKYLFATLFSNKKPILSDDLFERLYERFEDDIKLTENLLGRSLEVWKSKPGSHLSK